MRYTLIRGRSADDLLGRLARGRVVYAIEPGPDGRYHWARASAWTAGRHVLGPYRPVEPAKELVFRPREFLGPLFPPREATENPERIVLGVKSCDLAALRVTDQVFLQSEPVDPLYAEIRRKTIWVSADCTDALPVCFCTAVGQAPYPREGYDLNLSVTERGVLVESGSARGEALLEEARDLLDEAGQDLEEARAAQRERVTRRVREQTAALGLTEGMDFRRAIAGSVEAPWWDEFARDCVECGACNFVCCTCHCFLLADGWTAARARARMRQWDSCLFKNYARVAGGANPRGHRAERLWNRFDKKFCFFPQVLGGAYACDGCGRCVEACTGRIDIRAVLKRAVEEARAHAR